MHVCEDNQSAINMINARIPTEHSRHIDIQFFAIQDWKEQGNIVMQCIPGIIIPADDLANPLVGFCILIMLIASWAIILFDSLLGFVSVFVCHPCPPSTPAPGHQRSVHTLSAFPCCFSMGEGVDRCANRRTDRWTCLAR